MKQNQKMPLRVFREEYTKILDASSADELRAILIGMANKVDSQSRWDFIKKLVPAQSIQNAPIIFESDNILDAIESLKEDLLEQGDEEPDWEYDDEDSLAGYEQFLQPLSELFDKVEALFNAGHYEMAKLAYNELFSIFDIEDEYGRGIRIYDVVNTDLDEARARYLCSLYMTQTEKRVPLLLEAMEQLADLDFQERPKLQDMVNILMRPLPEFSPFLAQWINETKVEEKPSHDAWLREATLLLHGPKGLETLAKTEGHKRPRVYVDWVKALVDSKRYTEALNAAHTALDQLQTGKPIRAAIGDLTVLCGEQLHDEKIQSEGRWVSFKAKPDLSKLITLYRQDPNSDRSPLMKQAAEAIASMKQSDTYPYSRSWEKDDLESSSRISSTLLLTAHLFADDLNKAFELAKKGTSLGWSSDNPQPLFIAYCLINAAKVSLSNLPVHLKKFWEYALQTSEGSVWRIEGDTNEILQKLETIYQDIFSTPREIDKKMVDWCLTASHKRVEDIVINQHRKAYDRAALVTAACTQALQVINPSEATKFFWEIQNKFPRHSSFQAELGRVNIVK